MEATKLVFVSGVSGSGKTTLGEALKANHGYRHFDGDVYSFGGDPIAQSGETVRPDWGRSDELAVAYNAMMAAWVGEDLAPFAAFYDMFCAAVKERADQGDSPLVVTHSAYREKVRDLIRERLPGVKFVVLDVPLDICGERKVDNLVQTCEKRGISLSEFFRSFNPAMKDAPDLPLEQIKPMVIGMNTKGAAGFEPATEDEKSTFGITVTADMSKNDVVEKAVAALAS